MRRTAGRFVFVFVFGTIATVLGIVTSMTLTPPGRALLARVVSDQLDKVVNGTIEVGSISGSFLYGLTLEQLVVRDTQGVLLASIPRARVGYSLPRLLSGDIVLTEVHLDQPVIHLIQHHDGTFNYQDVLQLGRSSPRVGPPPLVAFHDVRITDGTLRIELPWRTADRVAPELLDSALAAERERPGRLLVSSPEGYRRVVLLEDLTTVLSRLQISTPDRRPFTIDLDTLATRVNDPAITITDAQGRVRLRGDSAVFSLERGAMPNSVVSGGGAVTWPNDTIMFDFQLEAPQVSLVDLRWVSPDFPAMTGSGIIAAKSESGTLTTYVVRDLALRRGAQRINGELVALQDKARGVGFRELDLTLQNVDLDAIRAYADTLPFYGTITGAIEGSGWLERMRVAVDWDFTDARVPGSPVSTIVASGMVGFTEGQGLYFDNVNLRDSDISLATVQRLAPAVVVPGRLTAVGTLDGPMKNVTFRGRARHRDGERPASELLGTVRLDTRGEELGVNMDVTLDPLSFEGIRRGFPSLPVRGSVSGELRMEGQLSRMQVDAELTGEIGVISAEGFVTMLPPRWGADALHVSFARLDLNAIRGAGPVTSLFGELMVSGTADTLRAPEGSLELAIGPSRVREWVVDTLYTRAAIEDSIIRVDTLYTEWKGASAGGAGTLGWARPHSGTMAFALAADSLTAFDSLLLAVTGQTRDSAGYDRPLGGSATAALTLTGSLDTLQVLGSFDARDLVFQAYRVPLATGTFSSTGGETPLLAVAVEGDSLMIQTDTTAEAGWTFDDIAFQARGRPDSLSWGLGTDVGASSRLDGTGWWIRQEPGMVLGIDTLSASLGARRWRLLEPTTLTLGDSTPLLAPTEIVAADRSGALRIAGRLPQKGPGDFTAEAFGLDLRNVYDFLGRDTTGVGGEIAFDVQAAGTGAAPTFRGTGSLAGARFGDSRLPHMEAIFDYADRRLDANLLLWRTGDPVLRVEAQLPFDLALQEVESRQVDGPLSVRAVGDSVDLAILEAFIPTIDEVHGFLTANIAIEGTWQEPELDGFLTVKDGGMQLTSLNVTWDSLNGRATFAGDSAVLHELRVTSEEGVLTATGSVTLEEFSEPVLDLEVTAEQFEVMAVRNFLDLTASGQFELVGPFYGATFSGTGVANAGVLYFADLINKQVIDLDDPANLALVDTAALRRNRLQEGFQTRFFEEMRIRNFALTMGSDFWLRSSEANIKLSGEVQAEKTLEEYRLAGTLEAGPGNYTLKIGPVTRDFTVQGGTVTYFGTPDLDAALDIEAQHVVRTSGGDEIPVIAHIGGTLLRPDLTLRSDPTQVPQLADVDLVSYLILGVPAGQAQVDDQSVLQNVTSLLTSAVSSDFERALVADLGLPVDLLEIRPALAGGTLAGGQVTQLAAGWQVGRRVFLRLNAGYCSEASVEVVGVGASIDYRLSRAWRLQTSFEPTYRTCRIQNEFDPSSAYQIGFDVLWQKEF